MTAPTRTSTPALTLTLTLTLTTDQDIYTREELIKAFSLSRVTKSPAVFDMKKVRVS